MLRRYYCGNHFRPTVPADVNLPIRMPPNDPLGRAVLPEFALFRHRKIRSSAHSAIPNAIVLHVLILGFYTYS